MYVGTLRSHTGVSKMTSLSVMERSDLSEVTRFRKQGDRDGGEISLTV